MRCSRDPVNEPRNLAKVDSYPPFGRFVQTNSASIWMAISPASRPGRLQEVLLLYHRGFRLRFIGHMRAKPMFFSARSAGRGWGWGDLGSGGAPPSINSGQAEQVWGRPRWRTRDRLGCARVLKPGKDQCMRGLQIPFERGDYFSGL